MARKHQIESGDVFGLLTAKELVPVTTPDGRVRNKWLCTCSCGEEVGPVAPAHLVNKVRSCKGCGYRLRGERQRKTGASNSARATFRNYRGSAKRRGIPFELSYEEFMSVVTLPCDYCGAERTSYFNPKPAWSQWGDRFEYTGIDRVSSSSGYVMKNVVPCCKVCNRAKSDLEIDVFKEWVSKVYHKLEYKR